MGQKLTVVYVEDRPAIAKLLSHGLSLFGIEVHHEYGSAEQLLADLDAPEVQDADVFIFDIQLPNMTGIELASKMRELGEERPLLLVSEFSEPQENDLDNLQAVFMAKPYNFPRLVSTLWNIAWS